LTRLLAVLGLVAALAVAALAQDPAPDVERDNSFILRLIEDRISRPGRLIRLGGVEGALSSRARIATITISDDRGVWLRLAGVEIDWRRVALVRRRLEIERLTAESVELLRRPEPPARTLADRLPQTEATPFRLPELPVAVRVAALALPRIDIAAPVLGEAARLSASGAADLARGALDATLDLRRLDGAGGELTLALDFSNATGVLDLDLRLTEPDGGVVAILLDLEDRPAIDARLHGEGPLDALDLDFAFDAGGARIAAGTVELRRAADGRGFAADFAGGLAPIVPAPYRDFFAGETSVALAGVALDGGGVRVERLAVRGAELELDGTLETAADGFPRSLSLAGRLGAPDGPPITLPVPGASTRIVSAELALDYGDGARWTGQLALDRLTTDTVEVGALTLDLGGRAGNLDDPARRDVTLAAVGAATGLGSPDPDLAAVIGQRLDIFVDAALPPGGPLTIRQAQAAGAGAELFAAGDLRAGAFDGRASLRLADLAPASGLAGRDLGGALTLRFDGSVEPLSGAFDLALDGRAEDLRLGDPRLDGLLQGATTLGGRVARDAEGFRTDGFRLANPQVEVTSTGRITRGDADLAVNARLADLAAIDPRASGAASLTGRLSGAGRPFALRLEATAPEAQLLARTLLGARLGFDGTVDGADVAGALRGGAVFDGAPVALTADLELDGPSRALRDLAVQVGPNTVTGDLAQAPGDVLRGALQIDAPDLAPLAALALTEASGAASATIRFGPGDVGQRVEFAARARDVAAGANRLGALDLDARIEDAFGASLAQGSLAASGLAVAGVALDRLSVTAEQTGPTDMRVVADARFAMGAEAELAAALAQRPGGFAATVDALTLREGEVQARLTAPATLTVAGDTIALTPLAFDLGGGRLTAAGAIAERFDVDVTLERLPLSLANAVAPGLGLEGTVDGALRVTGPRADPDASFDVTAEGVAAAASRAAGLPPAALTARGRTADGALRLDARATAGGAEISATGSAPLGPGRLALDVEIAALPLALLDRAAGGRGLAGQVAGGAQVSGTLAAPEVRFDLRGAGVTATPLADAGLAPLAVDGAGSFARDVLTLARLEVSNAQGLAVAASGRAPLRGPGLDLRASGTVPLSVANALLAARAAQAGGTARFDLTVRGSLSQPRLAGSGSLTGGSFTDPLTNLRLRDIAAEVGLDDQTVTLRSFRAASASGGGMSGSGTVSLAAGNPADLELRLDGLRYTDGAFVATTVDGRLRLTGPLRGGGLLSGRIDLGRTEVAVTEGLGGNALAAIEEVSHRRPSPGVVETLRRAGVDEPGRRAPAGAALRLDLRVEAPNQIFVRGRGLDVELGGGLRLTGSADDIVPVGQFDLRRGRLEVLGQRIEFEQGSLTLTGNLDPQVFLVARTRAPDVTAIVTVSGRVSSPDIRFSSEPPLPQDEVLARVLFGRDVSRLSPFQIAQLASAAAELAGGGSGGGVLAQLRATTGFDDLDIVTDEGGETALRAGRYLDENLYLDVQADTAGATRAEIVLEFNDNLTLRGSVGTDGNSTLGVFFERDY
jgi:translocation and assembly module TamB